MALSYRAELDNETKLFTALGFGEKRTSEPFLDSARAGAYMHGTDNITINDHGQAVVKSNIDGKEQLPSVIDFSKADMALPKKMSYDVTVNPSTKPEVGHLDLGADVFGSGVSFHVKSDGKIIDGACTTDKGITQCDETIKDDSGKLLLKGHTTANMKQNPANFERTTTYSSPDDKPLGTVSQHVLFDSVAKTVNAETTVKASP